MSNLEPGRAASAEHEARRCEDGCRVKSTIYVQLRAMPCVYCGKQPCLGVDHIVPFSDGGHHEVGNLQPMCKSCNSRKGSRKQFQLAFNF